MSDPIALWITPVSNLAGVARHILDVARVGIPGWRLVVTAPDGPLLDRLRELGCPVIPLPVDGVGTTTSVAALRHTLKRLRPAIAHSHLAKADILLAMASVGLPVQLVTTEHHIPPDRYMFHTSLPAAVAMESVHRLRLTRFAHAIAVSGSTKRGMLKYWHTKTPITVILNGVDRPVDPPARTSGLRLLSLTRLSPEKNLVMTLRVFARILESHPEATLTIAGKGDDEARLRQAAASLGIAEKVLFPGFVDAAEAMASHDVLLQPSKSDNCSYTLLDAVAQDLGVAASPIGGNPEILSAHCIANLDDDAGMARIAIEQGLDLGRRPTLPDTVPTVAEMAQRIAEVYGSLPTGLPQKEAPVTSRIYIASNQGEIGGGEVMLLALARAMRDLGRDVTVVGPRHPGELVAAASDQGFETVAIGGDSTVKYLANLRRWDEKERDGLLWCNGLRPAFATSGRLNRVVHLHQRPAGRLVAAAKAAGWGAARTLVPSHSMQKGIPTADVLWNWSEPVPVRPRRPMPKDRPITVGFLGRLSRDKGVHVLCDAVALLNDKQPGRFRLLLAGEARFVTDDGAAGVRQAVAGLGDLAEAPGWMDRDEFFGRVDLAVFPSVSAETFGLVVSEAMAARCPFVVSDAGALPEVAGPDYPFMARSADAASLADTIERAASAEWDDLLDASHRRWQEHFSPTAGRERLRDVLDQLDPPRNGDEAAAPALRGAVRSLDEQPLDPQQILDHADRFSPESFSNHHPGAVEKLMTRGKR